MPAPSLQAQLPCHGHRGRARGRAGGGGNSVPREQLNTSNEVTMDDVEEPAIGSRRTFGSSFFTGAPPGRQHTLTVAETCCHQQSHRSTGKQPGHPGSGSQLRPRYRHIGHDGTTSSVRHSPGPKHSHMASSRDTVCPFTHAGRFASVSAVDPASNDGVRGARAVCNQAALAGRAMVSRAGSGCARPAAPVRARQLCLSHVSAACTLTSALVRSEIKQNEFYSRLAQSSSAKATQWTSTSDRRSTGSHRKLSPEDRATARAHARTRCHAAKEAMLVKNRPPPPPPARTSALAYRARHAGPAKVTSSLSTAYWPGPGAPPAWASPRPVALPAAMEARGQLPHRTVCQLPRQPIRAAVL